MTRVALVVGINTYTHFPDLKAPAQDAEAIAQRLQHDGDFKVHRLPETLVREEEQFSPTVGETLSVPQAQLEASLKQLFRPDSAQIPDTALFYFSGHGLPDPEGEAGLDKGYLVASDTDPRQTRPGVSLAWVQNLLAHSPIANQIVWLDCCHSGGLLINVQAANPGHRHDRSRCFIASSRDFEKSWQDLNSPYSVLTKALLQGLDPSRLPGRWVDTFALVDYVNQALKGELQTPTCTNFGDAINLTRTWQVADEITSEAATDSGLCPYKGLEFFDLNDTDPQKSIG
ncbi:MAG: caspase family protein, partial [Cyanobacteria bacterium P01_F01_bin.4]